MAEDKIEMVGEVVDLLPGARFKIKLLDKLYADLVIDGHLSGKMRINYIKLMPGDYVRIDISIYDLTKGRITYRFRAGEYEKMRLEEAAIEREEAQLESDVRGAEDINTKN